MTDTPRYATLRDYLKVLREQRWIIILATAIFAGAALGLSLKASPTYQTQASLQLHDQSGNASLLSNSLTVLATPQELQASLPATVNTPPIAAAANGLLGRGPRPAASVSAYSDQTSGQVIVQAQSGDAAFAARYANAYANALAQVNNNAVRAQFLAAATALRRQFARLSGIARDPVTRSLYADRITSALALSETARPVSVAQPASVRSTPVSPRPVRNALLGALLGFVLGILAAFTRDALDQRLRDASDVSDTLGWPVVGHIRREAMGSGGPLAVKGTPRLTEPDFEAFRILRQNLLFLNVDAPPRVIVVSSALPDEGKSTVAASLACACAVAGRRTLLVECDLRRPCLATRMGLQAGPGLVELLIADAALSDVVQVIAPELFSPNGNQPTAKQPVAPAAEPGWPVGRNQAADAGPYPLGVITAGQQTSHPAELLGSQRFKQFLEGVAASFEIVILDTSPVLAVADTLELLPQAHASLLCVRASKSTRNEARALRDAIQRLPDQPVGVVVTGLRPGSEHDFGYYSYSYGYGASR